MARPPLFLFERRIILAILSIVTANPKDGTGHAAGDIVINKTTWDVLSYDGKAWTTEGNIKGAKGDPGAKGEKGEKGDPGAAGGGGVTTGALTYEKLVPNVKDPTVDGPEITFYAPARISCIGGRPSVKIGTGLAVTIPEGLRLMVDPADVDKAIDMDVIPDIDETTGELVVTLRPWYTSNATSNFGFNAGDPFLTAYLAADITPTVTEKTEDKG